MRPKGDTKKLQKVYETLGLSLETLKAKRKEWRNQFKKLKRCKPVVQTICTQLLPLEGAALSSKSRHLTAKQAKKLGLEAVTQRHNELLAVCSMQNDAFQHMFELMSFTTRFAAVYEEQDNKRKNEMSKLYKDVKAAMQGAAANGKPTPKRKPANKQVMKDFLRSCGSGEDSDDEDEEEEEEKKNYTLKLFS